jgi:crotonobetainyl-CoA:carnitine CoA-transferase CaiB-like acyl-CoA transferase
LEPYFDRNRWFAERDTIKKVLADHLAVQTTQYWIDRLQPIDYWCAPVMTWPELLAHEGFRVLDMLQDVVRPSGASVRTTRCPIRIDGELMLSDRGAPRLGEHNAEIDRAFGIDGHVSANIQADHHP